MRTRWIASRRSSPPIPPTSPRPSSQCCTTSDRSMQLWLMIGNDLLVFFFFFLPSRICELTEFWNIVSSCSPGSMDSLRGPPSQPGFAGQVPPVRTGPLPTLPNLSGPPSMPGGGPPQQAPMFGGQLPPNPMLAPRPVGFGPPQLPFGPPAPYGAYNPVWLRISSPSFQCLTDIYNCSIFIYLF